MKNILIACFLLLSFGLNAHGGDEHKTTTLSGQVTDQQGEPLIGAKIKIAGIDQAVYTDFEGKFILENIRKDRKELQISHIAFIKKHFEIDLNQIQAPLQLKLSSK